VKIAFRLEVGKNHGTGHFKRCFELAKFFKKKCKIYFICSNLEKNLIKTLEEDNIKFYKINNKHILNNEPMRVKDQKDDSRETIEILKSINCNMLIKDSYNFNHVWEKNFMEKKLKLIVISDDYNKHYCNLFINFHMHSNTKLIKNKLITKNNLLGSKYAISTSYVKKYSLNNIKKSNKIVLVLSNSEIYKKTYIDIIDALLIRNYNISVILGHKNNFHFDIKNNYKKNSMKNQITFFNYINRIEDLLVDCKFAITGGGFINYEKCILGVPSLVVILSNDQKLPSKKFENINTLKIIAEFDDNKFHKKLNNCLDLMKPELIKKMSLNSKNIFDGLGAKRIYQHVIKQF
tara:strand:- start:3812 stop:4855 length:1044 start_codon:yes stop_codon:yes gene_type:complete